MRTYRYHSRGLTRGLRLLCALALLLWTGSALEAQDRRFLVELGAGAVYQSFDSVTKLNGGIGGVGRLGVWLPYRFSVEAEASLGGPNTSDTDISVSTRTVIASVLYNIPLGENNWVHLRAGGGSSKYGDPCPTDISSTIICGSSSALVAGAGLRVGVTPLLLVRGDASLTRNKTGRTGDAFTNFGVSLGLSYMLGSKPIADSDGDGILD